MRPDLPLLVAANRDEFHARPAAPAGWWSDEPDVLAGRDLEAKGTWMGVTRSGRFAAVTNFRGAREPSARESRGALVTGALLRGADRTIADVEPRAAQYSGFNLLAAEDGDLWVLSNRGGGKRRLGPGVYGLGNTLLDAPEVAEAKTAFESLLAAPAAESLISLLGRWRILNEVYGTRCSTVLRKERGRLRYVERTWSPTGEALGTEQFSLAP